MVLTAGQGKRILFVTNNSTKSRASYLRKFRSLNIEASVDEIFGSSYAAAYYIKNNLHLPTDKKVYVCGMAGIEEELASLGVSYVDASRDNVNINSMDEIGTIKPDPSIGAVLCGFDLHINYRKIATAFTYLRSNPECHFLATNSDLTYPAARTVYPGVTTKAEAETSDIKAKYSIESLGHLVVGQD
ncbi:hypothetical protein HK101_006056 [Irineochytrium annulatum]|nr:hypothetical protein HK101_006056 [Irineochytrium annulatum]